MTPDPTEAVQRAVALHLEHQRNRARATEVLEARNEALRAAYDAGATVPHLARALGVSGEAVSKAMGRHARGPRPATVPTGALEGPERAREENQSAASPSPAT